MPNGDLVIEAEIVQKRKFIADAHNVRKKKKFEEPIHQDGDEQQGDQQEKNTCSKGIRSRGSAYQAHQERDVKKSLYQLEAANDYQKLFRLESCPLAKKSGNGGERKKEKRIGSTERKLSPGIGGKFSYIDKSEQKNQDQKCHRKAKSNPARAEASDWGKYDETDEVDDKEDHIEIPAPSYQSCLGVEIPDVKPSFRRMKPAAVDREKGKIISAENNQGQFRPRMIEQGKSERSSKHSYVFSPEVVSAGKFCFKSAEKMIKPTEARTKSYSSPSCSIIANPRGDEIRFKETSKSRLKHSRSRGLRADSNVGLKDPILQWKIEEKKKESKVDGNPKECSAKKKSDRVSTFDHEFSEDGTQFKAGKLNSPRKKNKGIALSHVSIREDVRSRESNYKYTSAVRSSPHGAETQAKLEKGPPDNEPNLETAFPAQKEEQQTAPEPIVSTVGIGSGKLTSDRSFGTPDGRVTSNSRIGSIKVKHEEKSKFEGSNTSRKRKQSLERAHSHQTFLSTTIGTKASLDGSNNHTKENSTDTFSSTSLTSIKKYRKYKTQSIKTNGDQGEPNVVTSAHVKEEKSMVIKDVSRSSTKKTRIGKASFAHDISPSSRKAFWLPREESKHIPRNDSVLDYLMEGYKWTGDEKTSQLRRKLGILDPTSGSALKSLLLDCEGSARGKFIELNPMGLGVLVKGILECEHGGKLENVSGSRNLKTRRYDYAGFNELKIPESDVAQVIMEYQIHKALCDLGFCHQEQDVDLHMSFLVASWSMPQKSHIDYKWEDVLPKTGESYSSQDYRHRVPFIAIYPLCQAGTYVEVWDHKDHRMPRKVRSAKQKGHIVFIPFGHLLLLRADTVHAGGLCTNKRGNPRGHFYIHKTCKSSRNRNLKGTPYPRDLTNIYYISETCKQPLDIFYTHFGDSM